jgi:hydroxypyruvate reductase
VVEAGHPAPDTASVAAARRMMELARSLGEHDTLWFLVSGGGSALLASPLPGVTLDEKRALATCLMHGGADIREINVVRKHLSAIKGGRLASLAHPARVRTLAISDVPGDSLADIASGPTIPDPTTREDALAIAERYRCPLTAAVRVTLDSEACESPKPGAASFAADTADIIACATTALDAAEAALIDAGYRVVRLGDDLAEPARALGATHAALALDAARAGGRHAFLSGGETRVVVTNPEARGGRNLEYLGSLALALDGASGVVALAADTDGIDGNGDHAGGLVVPDILDRGRATGIELDAALAVNATYDYFDRCKLLIRTGPTRTNVNDFRLILVDRTTME